MADTTETAREEEVEYDGRFEATLLGFLNEDSSPVSKVHLGVVFLVFTLGLEFSFPRMVAMRRRRASRLCESIL